MKKIIKLTETDLTRIVNRAVRENKFNIVKKSNSKLAKTTPAFPK